eukprot:CAMPEP_0183713424 /NCGR_PEP_ID=MMETSP0737-20130205/8268_1 /TAXON_ID=385413 /ORGANISM="Thalassiosira miniscula, Strain CCMP1093" /LENGTH=662 /DNA_ID=CAMNT_0025942199 /DNA_START=282 /DNA_END=2270 /DNA_ORIENTATION=-
MSEISETASEVASFTANEDHNACPSDMSENKKTHGERFGGDEIELSKNPGRALTLEANATARAVARNNDEAIENEDMEQDISCKRRKLSTDSASAADSGISLRKLIPLKDCQRIRRILQASSVQQSVQTSNGYIEQSDDSSLGKVDWSVVIARARFHPNEVAESYFRPIESFQEQEDHIAPSNNDILAYRPLHAMLKYDPPLDAVKAIVQAYPEAALDVTFEGSALKIAAESRVSSMLVLRLLLVAEMAMRKRSELQPQLQEEEDQEKDRAQSDSSNLSLKRTDADGKFGEHGHGDQGRSLESTDERKDNTENRGIVDTLLAPQTNMLSGHNPIRWITERRIPVKTAALLLRWYPVGAFQRTWDTPADTSFPETAYSLQGIEAESPLIEIVDNFARDHYGDKLTTEDIEISSDDSKSDCEDGQEQVSSDGMQESLLSQARRHQEHYEDMRWEKFLHILYATDQALQSTRVRTVSPPSVAATSDTRDDVNATNTESPTGSPSADEVESSSSYYKSGESVPSNPKGSGPPAPSVTLSSASMSFHPVHAWIRCLTSPYLRLEQCRPYSAWSVLCFMSQRIPFEFIVRDEGDGNRTPLQILAESRAKDCSLCNEEVKGIIECLMGADYHSAFLPRKSDGRLISHVALENGWPCKDLFSNKTFAASA